MDGFRTWGMIDYQSRFSSSPGLPRTLAHSQSMHGLFGIKKAEDAKIPERSKTYSLSFDPLVKAASYTPRRRRHKITLENIHNEGNKTSPGLSPPRHPRPSTLPRACNSSSVSKSASFFGVNLRSVDSGKSKL